MPTYEQNKNSIYRYRLKHVDKVREIDRKSKKRKYDWKKIQTIYLKILLD